MSLIQPYLAVMTDTDDNVVPTVKRFHETLQQAKDWCNHHVPDSSWQCGLNENCWTFLERMDDVNWRVYTIIKVI